MEMAEAKRRRDEETKKQRNEETRVESGLSRPHSRVQTRQAAGSRDCAVTIQSVNGIATGAIGDHMQPPRSLRTQGQCYLEGIYLLVPRYLPRY